MDSVSMVSRDAVLAHTRAIARWVRLSGSADERAAATYVEAQLASAGYRTATLLHDAYISLPGKASLRLIRPEGRIIPCITHSMARPTREEGIMGEVVYVGEGTPGDYVRAAAAGRIALAEGPAYEDHAVHATEAGVAALICISGEHPHEMCCSPVWGNPSSITVRELPGVPILSIAREDGRALAMLCAGGRVEVHLSAAVDTRWTQTPIVVADLGPRHPDAESGTYVLFSGHLDSWHQGAMDNGGANAAMLEVARILALRQSSFRRGLRIAFWSGHSHGRYSSSAWYADNHWFDLASHCVMHVNIDSIGAVGADTFATNSMPQTLGLAAWAVERVTGAVLKGRRVGRNSDQSFLGIGIPSILGSVSRQADGSLGWWWHTPYDTLDKIDPQRLARDTSIFVLLLERLLADPVLPVDYAAAAADLYENLDQLSRAAGEAFDLSDVIDAASNLTGLCSRLNAAAEAASPAQAAAINRCLRTLGTILIPATYTSGGRYRHDPAMDVEFLPRLSRAREFAGMARESDAARFLLVDLVRGRNAVLDGIHQACRIVAACLDQLANSGIVPS